MTIMFAGGMTLAIPGFMPVVAADFSSTDGYLTVSSTSIQGGAILEVVINDPAYSATDSAIGGGPVVTLGGTDYIASQGVDGKWYAYFADFSTSNGLDDSSATGLDYGEACPGLGTNGTSAGVGGGVNFDIVGTTTTVWAQPYEFQFSDTDGSAGTCLNIDGAPDDFDGLAASSTSGATGRSLMSVLANPPALSDHDDSNTDLGQRNHALNGTSGVGSWPFIFADTEFTSDNVVEYKPTGDSITVTFGNTDGDTTISLANENPSEFHEIHLAIDDPALNIDPTTPDLWMFDLTSPANVAAKWMNNGSNTHITDTVLLANGCVSNCDLTTSDLDGDGSNDSDVLTGFRSVNMTESSANSAHFESWDATGASGLDVAEGAGGDNAIQFNYGGNSVMMIITYNDASMTLETESGDGTWAPGETATMTIVDPDLNKNPASAETLSIGDETAKVPTIKIGSPFTITDGMTEGEQIAGTADTGGTTCAGTDGQDEEDICVSIGSEQGAVEYTGLVRATYDQSERMRITFDGGQDPTSAYGTTTWINVTTGITVQEVSDKSGTAVLSYDVTGAADEMSGVSAISVFLLGTGSNATNTSGSDLISLVTAGAATSGVANLCPYGAVATTAGQVCSEDIHGKGASLWDSNENSNTENIAVAFKFTHDASAVKATDGHGQMANDADFAIAADFCFFDQNNGTDTHDCIYRIEAEETGDDTGVFVGTVEYIQLNNSTTADNRTTRGVHNGNDYQVDGLLTTNSDAVTVVLMDGIDGTSSLRISHNDTDSLGASDEVQKQLDAYTHTGSVSLDADQYADDDMATITIIDPDLNQNSSDRETYTNSSATFQITCTDGVNPEISQSCVESNQVIIETGPNTGVFVGTFTVPGATTLGGSANANLGEDMEITYFESADAAGEAIEFYDTATIASNDGGVALSKSVYPLPFTVDDLFDGSDTADTKDHSGNVTATITVTEPDNANDTLTVTSGNIKVKLIHGTTTTELFTGGASSATSTTTSTDPPELGPLTETERGTSVYEVDMTIQKKMCGPDLDTAGADSGSLKCQDVKSGDIIQVEYIDTSDSAGATSTFYDSSTFDLRNASLSTDKDVYVIGSDMVVTLNEPDLNLSAGDIDSYFLNLIEWDSDADGSELLNQTDDFTTNPTKLQETGADTGVFQTVVTIPVGIFDGSTTTQVAIDFGEAVTLTYVDTGVAGEDDYTDDKGDVEAKFSISNFGALIELDKAVYGWKDTVYITITAPDHNQNSASEETIGTTALPIQVTTRVGKMCTSTTGATTYKAVETDEDTGVFAAEISLGGFAHTMSSDTTNTSAGTATCGTGDTDGVVNTAGQTDGVSVSYEYNDNSVVVASASIVWNIAEVSWDSSSVAAGGSAVFTVTDSDENLDSTITDTFTIAVYSDSDNGGMTLTMNETDEDTGVFQGTAYFTTDLATSVQHFVSLKVIQ